MNCEVGSRYSARAKFYLALGIVKRKKPVGVETLVAQPSVEGFDQRIVGRLAGPAEVERDLVQIGPLVERA